MNDKEILDQHYRHCDALTDVYNILGNELYEANYPRIVIGSNDSLIIDDDIICKISEISENVDKIKRIIKENKK